MKNLEIQILRAIAMIAVLLGHMPIVLPNIVLHGYTFVSLFFAISGYFAVVQFQKKYKPETHGYVIVKNEAVNKCMRLVPLMLIWILIYFLIGNMSIYMGGQYGNLDRWACELKAALMLNYNYYLAGLDIGGLFGQYWSLYVEIHFFILFVFLFAIVRSKKSRIAICIALILLTVVFLRPLTPVKLIRYATQAHLDSLFCGALIGLCCEQKSYLKKLNIPGVVKKIIGILLCVSLFLAGYFFDNYYNDANIKYTVYTVLSAAILFLARENDGWFGWGGILGKVLVWCGDTSASVYVSHVILYSCIYYNLYYHTSLISESIKTTTIGIVAQVLFLLVAACLVGRLSYRLIEVPYGNLAKKYMNKQREEITSV